MRLRWIIAALAVVVVVVALGGLLGKQQLDRFADRPIALASPILYELKPGTSFRTLVADLASRGVIEDPLQLRLFARLQEQAHLIKSGEYQLTPGITHGQLLQQFVDGRVLQRQLTLVEGLRVSDYLQLLAQQSELEQTLQGKTVDQVAQLLGLGDTPLEGWIYPDTYSYTKGTRDIDVLRRAYQRMQQVLAEEWDARSQPLPLNSPYEALILASIVEKETGAPEERAAIAGVFVRRLQKNMRLQTDPTVIYGMGDNYRGNIRRSDLTRYTPYNTYKIDGLPPTPIANPGREAIHASLHPAPGKALYFVAKGDGRHQFSATLVEHNRAVQVYQKRQRRQDYRSSPATDSDKSEG